MASPKRPVASASAKPRNAKGWTWPWEAGLRATELIRAANTLPMPTPAPTSAMQARPAPSIFAAARSIAIFLLADGKRRSVKVERVAEIETSQDGEDVGLQQRHQQFQADQRDVNGDREDREDPDRGGKPAEDRQHRVPGQHVGEQPDRQRERPDEVGQDLDRHQQHEQYRRHTLGDEQPQEMRAVP